MKARRVVRPAALWREVDLSIRAAIALDAKLGTAYEHEPLCACPICVEVVDRLAAIVWRCESEVRQRLTCEVCDDLGDDT